MNRIQINTKFKDLAKEFIDIRLSLNFSSESHMPAHNKEFYYSLLEG